VLLGLSGGTAFYGINLACDLVLGLSDVGDSAGVKLAGVLLLLILVVGRILVRG
jgi:hypothetical protein